MNTVICKIKTQVNKIIAILSKNKFSSFLGICLLIVIIALIFEKKPLPNFSNVVDTLKVSVTVLISMMGFSVSIYVFLNTTLQNRRNTSPIEKEIILLFQQRRKKRLGISIVYTICIVFIEITIILYKAQLKDWVNTIHMFSSNTICLSAIIICIILTFINIILLGYFTYGIINYDDGLKALAIEERAKHTDVSYYESINKGDFLNLVNNIEVITERLIENHMHAKTSNAYESSFKRAICDGITDAGDIKTREKLAKDYKEIIEYRNLLLQDSSIEDSTKVGMGDDIKSVMNRLFQLYLKNELLTNINISNLNIAEANLSKTSFNNSSLQNISFCGETSLESTDFRNSTLNHIMFYSKDKKSINEKIFNCENINFSNAKLVDIKFNVDMNLHRSIFENADLSSIGELGPSDKEGEPISFFNSIFRKANLSHLEIYNVCFDFSNLSCVRMIDSSIGKSAQKHNNVTFKYSDMTGIDMLRCVIERCNFKNANLETAVLTYAKIDDVTFIETRLNGTTFAESTISNCSFEKAYCTDASFKESKINKSSFNYATMLRADMSGATLKKINFEDTVCRDTLWVHTVVSDSNLRRCVFSGSRIVGENNNYTVIQNCDFSYANFSDSAITNIEFKNCNFVYADFSNVRLVNVTFSNCEGLNTICTTNVWLSNVNYTGQNTELHKPDNGWRNKEVI